MYQSLFLLFLREHNRIMFPSFSSLLLYGSFQIHLFSYCYCMHICIGKHINIQELSCLACMMSLKHVFRDDYLVSRNPLVCSLLGKAISLAPSIPWSLLCSSWCWILVGLLHLLFLSVVVVMCSWRLGDDVGEIMGMASDITRKQSLTAKSLIPWPLQSSYGSSTVLLSLGVGMCCR